MATPLGHINQRSLGDDAPLGSDVFHMSRKAKGMFAIRDEIGMPRIPQKNLFFCRG